MKLDGMKLDGIKLDGTKLALVEMTSEPRAEPVPWRHGPRQRAGFDSEEITAAVERCLLEAPDLVALWDLSLGRPDGDLMLEIALSPGDVWHAGLRLGQGARPELLDRVHPTWMLAHDPPAELDASSWRVSLRACLFRAAVWQTLGGPDPGYGHLDGAALELGHRWLWGGAILRHSPGLLQPLPASNPEQRAWKQELNDEMRFLFQRTGRFWATWALARGLMSRRLGLAAIGAWWRQRRAPQRTRGELRSRVNERGEGPRQVTVLIPTLDRYPYLRVVLEQLERQSVQPLEVIVIDQTAPEKRRRDWHQSAKLKLRVIERDEPGQSSARNAGLLEARGDVILFLDDDIEMADDLIARHLEILATSGADASCGVAEEVGAGELPPEFQLTRLSDVFPTCNTALRRAALHRSGLFDLAFDHGARADADLGTRLYLSGALLVLAPSVSVVHHKAPAGGLRQHKARVATYAASRRSLMRHLPSVTEIYLAYRYGTPSAPREMLWQRALGTLRARGSLGQKALKLLWGLAWLPDTLARIISRARRARAMLHDYPRIPRLDEEAP